MRRGLVVCVVAASVLATAGGARAESVSAGTLRQLARAAAAGDAQALARLRGVDRVDGRAVDLGDALAGSVADVLRRLAVLAAASPEHHGRPDPRREARIVLAQPRFHGSEVPRPFHRALVWMGEKLAPAGPVFRRLARHVPGGSAVLWLILALLVVGVAAVATVATARWHGLSAPDDRLGADGRAARVDPALLEREADEAERSGRPADALRLRFRAGLLRLARARVLPARASLTSGEARRSLKLDDFDRLARTHDEVVFGGRQARPEDAVEAREGWQRVLAATRAAR